MLWSLEQLICFQDIRLECKARSPWSQFPAVQSLGLLSVADIECLPKADVSIESNAHFTSSVIMPSSKSSFPADWNMFHCSCDPLNPGGVGNSFLILSASWLEFVSSGQLLQDLLCIAKAPELAKVTADSWHYRCGWYSTGTVKMWDARRDPHMYCTMQVGMVGDILVGPVWKCGCLVASVFQDWWPHIHTTVCATHMCTLSSLPQQFGALPHLHTLGANVSKENQPQHCFWLSSPRTCKATLCGPVIKSQCPSEFLSNTVCCMCSSCPCLASDAAV